MSKILPPTFTAAYPNPNTTKKGSWFTNPLFIIIISIIIFYAYLQYNKYIISKKVKDAVTF